LNFDVVIDDLRVRGQASGNEAVDVSAVKALVESDAIKLWRGMECFELAERSVRAGKDRSGDPEEGANRKDNAQGGDIRFLTACRFECHVGRL